MVEETPSPSGPVSSHTTAGTLLSKTYKRWKKPFLVTPVGGFTLIAPNENPRKLRETFKESIMALVLNVFGLVAGTIVAFHLRLFELTPWAIAVYPAILSARGVIGGLLSGRLSTGLHLGTVQPRFFGNTRDFYMLIQAVVVLTLETSVLMSTVLAFFGSFSWGATATDFVSVLCVILATMTLALVIISPLTITVSCLSFKHGLDPDIILYPVESTTADVFVTLCYSLMLSLFSSHGLTGRYLIGLFDLIALLTVAFIISRNIREHKFAETIKESFLTLVAVAFIVNVTGSVLSKVFEAVGRRGEIYTVYPALIDTIGDVGSVVGSTATTKLALGTLKPSLFVVKSHMSEMLSAWAASLVMFVVYSVFSLAMQEIFTLGTFLRFTALLLVANLMAAPSIIIVAYMVAVLTFRRGLDPDNFVIPIESSLADGLTTVSLLVALILIG